MNVFLAPRILAVDLHPRSFAFAVFEGPRKLIDWGARSFRTGTNAVLVRERQKLAHLLDRYTPRIILLQKPKARDISRMLAAIRREAVARRIPVRVLSPEALRRAFSGRSGNKYEIAAAIAASLPELRTILPPKRKPWESERYTMSIFDAAAVGIAHFAPRIEGASCPPSVTVPYASSLSNGPRG